MKLVSYRGHSSDSTRLGCYRDGTVIDLTVAYAEKLAQNGEPKPEWRAERLLPSEMLSYLRLGDAAIERTHEALEFEDQYTGEASIRFSIDEITLRSPLSRPNSLRDCSVYEEHLLNARGLEPGSLPEFYYQSPIYYNGNPDSIVHPGTDVSWPGFTEQLDYELEIAAVIGKGGTNIAPEKADEHIFGYTIFNDFSARDLQAAIKPLMVGPSKSKDFANGLGPYLVTADSIDITDCSAVTRINGEIWSEGTTGGMEHSWAEIISYLSEEMTLHAGDVIGSGTVASGCGLELDRWIEPGDRIELTVDGIGTLEHTVSK